MTVGKPSTNPPFGSRILYIKRVKATHSMSTAREELKRILSQPETRIKYAFEFMNDFVDDEDTKIKCYNQIAIWSDKLDWSEAHY